MRVRCFTLIFAAAALIVLFLSVAVPRPAQSAEATPPDSIAVIGDSIASAWGTQVDDDGANVSGDFPPGSFATGTNPVVTSHLIRLRAAGASIPDGSVQNYALGGRKIANEEDGVVQQATLVKPGTDYVAIEVGSADLCAGDVIQPSDLAPASQFEGQIRKVMTTLTTNVPGVHILAASIPNWYQIWQDFPSKTRSVGTCPMLVGAGANDTTRQAVRDTTLTYNARIKKVCLEFTACSYDGDDVYGVHFAEADLSTVDYFHPNLSGQAKLAAVTWPIVHGFFTGALPGPSTALPDSIAVAGNSIATAWGSGVVASANVPGDNRVASFVTGTDSAVNSHLLRLRAAGASIPDASAQNYAQPSRKVTNEVDGIVQQVTLVKAGTDYVALETGTTDLCASDIATANDFTSADVLELQIRKALTTLTNNLPRVHILLASIPNWYQVWQDFPNKSRGSNTCPMLFGAGANDATRQAVKDMTITYNARLKRVCLDFGNCTYDGDAVFGVHFTEDDLSTVDYFHPSVSGQAKLAAATWTVVQTFFSGSPPPPPPPPPGSLNWAANPSADFDGDRRTDLGALYRGRSPQDSLWFALASNGGSAFQIYFGATSDVPVPGDYDGDGKTDAVIFRPSTGLWYGPRTGAASIVIQQIVGQNGDIPVPGDYNGDGKTDPAIYRPSTGMFFAVLSGGGVLQKTFGAPGDIPVPRDYDGDGKTDPAIYRANVSNGLGLWYATLSGGGVYQIYFGASTDIPVPGDYNGDKRAEAVIFRPSTGLWYGPFNGASGLFQMVLGQSGDIPIPGYYDANLSVDPAIYRPSTGLWFSALSGGGTRRVDGLGLSSDVPIQKRPTLAGGR